MLLINLLRKIFVILLIINLLSACGGSSGSGGGSGRNDRFGIRVMHAAIEAPPLEFTHPNDSSTLQRVRFLGESFYINTPEGPLALALFTANSGGSDLVVTAPIIVPAESRQSVLIFGEAAGGFRTVVFDDLPLDNDSQDSAVRIINGANGASAIRVILSDAVEPITILRGGASQYVNLPSGPIQYTAFRTTDGTTVASGSILAEEGQRYSVLIAGESGVFVAARVFEG